MSKQRIAAHALQPGDVVGSGDVVVHTYVGARTPPRKIHVVLATPQGLRTSLWGKYTIIGIEREEMRGG